ncbi:glycerophosphodiester phosphodiesterase family protein [Pseudorhodoferax sp.]|uniref:glycerophosphodiester phosphodiesterase family protein n=1 Tax=Pseudorhodoferax sp. TaxID=1993553 RepID=UPI0039E4F335
MPSPLLPRAIRAAATAVLAAGAAWPAAAAPAAAIATTTAPPAPIVIAHRGASGYLPEHTLAAYELAVHMGADYIEPDLRLTRDGHLVALHDATLERTTDAAERFAPRHGGWRVADFSLQEIRSLAVRPQGMARLQVPGFAPTSPHPLRVPTFEEIILLARRLEAGRGRPVGLYPELKDGGPRIVRRVLETLAEHGYRAADPVFLQSFHAGTLQDLRRRQQAMGPGYRLVLLGGSANQLLATGLDHIAGFADAVGVNVHGEGMSRSFIALAHQAGLAVHGYTFAEPRAAAAVPELRKYFNWGMDGAFANYPDLALRARAAGPRGPR